jgi:hypothetical protein
MSFVTQKNTSGELVWLTSSLLEEHRGVSTAFPPGRAASAPPVRLAESRIGRGDDD